MSSVKRKYAQQIQKLSVSTGGKGLDGKSADYISAYYDGYRRARYDAAVIACSADADINSLTAELVNAHNQLLMAAECIDKGRVDEALLHCQSLVRPRRNTLALFGVDI